MRRGSDNGVKNKAIRPGHKINNWRRLLTCSGTKSMLTKFLVESWRNTSKRKKLCGQVLLVTCEDQCYMLTSELYKKVPALRSSHEKADTRLFLHCKHASNNYNFLVINAYDTDVFILALSMCNQIKSNIFIRRGTKLISITKLS